MSGRPPIEQNSPSLEKGSPSSTLSDSRKKAMRDGFLQQLFARGKHLEQSFHKICNAGCPAQEFSTLLWSTCCIISYRSIPLVNGGGLSKAQLKKLPTQLRSLADVIESLNSSALAPANDIKLAPFDEKRKFVRDYMIRRYESLPGVLRIYSSHMEMYSTFAQKIAKRLTGGHFLTIRLLRWVEDHTGSPLYQDINDLLEHGCMVAEKTDSAPKFLTADNLATMYRRWGDAVCGPRSRSRS